MRIKLFNLCIYVRLDKIKVTVYISMKRVKYI